MLRQKWIVGMQIIWTVSFFQINQNLDAAASEEMPSVERIPVCSPMTS